MTGNRFLLSATPQFPQRVTVELTNRCNLSCVFCPRHHMTYPLGDMKPALFRKIVDELSEAGTRTLVPFFRGEPFLHSHCLPLLEYAKARGFAIQLATNGHLLTRELSREVVALKIDFLSFSVDAIDAKEYEAIRRGGNFETLMSNIDGLMEQRKRLGSHLPRIQISAVDTGMDEERNKRFLEFWQDKADQVRFYPRHSENGKFGSLHRPQKTKRRACSKPFKEMVIYWDGRTAICNHDWDRHSGPGTGEKGVMHVWKSHWYRQIRRMQAELSFDNHEPCVNCDHWLQYCHKGKIIGEMRKVK